MLGRVWQGSLDGASVAGCLSARSSGLFAAGVSDISARDGSFAILEVKDDMDRKAKYGAHADSRHKILPEAWDSGLNKTQPKSKSQACTFRCPATCSFPPLFVEIWLEASATVLDRHCQGKVLPTK